MNYSDYNSVKTMEEMANRLGFKPVPSKFQYTDIALIPLRDETHDCLPCYADDTQFGYYGTVTGNISFMKGWDAALQYLAHIGAADKKRIEKMEELYRQKRLLQLMKDGK